MGRTFILPADGGPPSVAARMLIGAVQFYRLFFKAWLGSACRFEPTCSAYALEALDRHGAAAGSYLTAARLLRCHPGCSGGCDPVPARPPFRGRNDPEFTETASMPMPATPVTPVHAHLDCRKSP